MWQDFFSFNIKRQIRILIRIKDSDLHQMCVLHPDPMSNNVQKVGCGSWVGSKSNSSQGAKSVFMSLFKSLIRIPIMFKGGSGSTTLKLGRYCPYKKSSRYWKMDKTIWTFIVCLWGIAKSRQISFLTYMSRILIKVKRRIRIRIRKTGSNSVWEGIFKSIFRIEVQSQIRSQNSVIVFLPRKGSGSFSESGSARLRIRRIIYAGHTSFLPRTRARSELGQEIH